MRSHDDSTMSVDGPSPAKRMRLSGLSALGGGSTSVTEHLIYNFKDLKQDFKTWVLTSLDEKLRESPDRYMGAIKHQATALEKHALTLYNNNQEK
jgi:hypothetical protein